MAKDILFGTEAQSLIKDGVDKLADAAAAFNLNLPLWRGSGKAQIPIGFSKKVAILRMVEESVNVTWIIIMKSKTSFFNIFISLCASCSSNNSSQLPRML